MGDQAKRLEELGSERSRSPAACESLSETLAGQKRSLKNPPRKTTSIVGEMFFKTYQSGVS